MNPNGIMITYDAVAGTLWVNGVAFSMDFFAMFSEGYDRKWRVQREIGSLHVQVTPVPEEPEPLEPVP